MKKSILALFILTLLSCGPKNNLNKVSNTLPVKSVEWTFDKVQGSKLIFKGGHSFETSLFELEYIGQVVTEKKSPFLIFSGRDCQSCDANIGLYIHSPEDGDMIVANGHNQYSYPGIEKDYLTDSLVYRARTFYGQVLKDTKGVIWYQDQLKDNGKMDHSIFLVQLSKVKRDTSLAEDGNLKETLDYLKQGLCKEIKGGNFTSEP